MAKLRVLNSSGDTVVEWNRRLLETEDSETKAAVKEAERIFEEQRARGATAFIVKPGTNDASKRIDAFDPSAEEIIIVPQIVGGS